MMQFHWFNEILEKSLQKSVMEMQLQSFTHLSLLFTVIIKDYSCQSSLWEEREVHTRSRERVWAMKTFCHHFYWWCEDQQYGRTMFAPSPQKPHSSQFHTQTPLPLFYSQTFSNLSGVPESTATLDTNPCGLIDNENTWRENGHL